MTLTYMAGRDLVGLYGDTWEVQFTQHYLGDGTTGLKLEAYEDAHPGLFAQTELLAALATEQPSTVGSLVALFKRLGVEELQIGLWDRLLNRVAAVGGRR